MCGSVISFESIENASMESIIKLDGSDAISLVLALLSSGFGYLAVAEIQKFRKQKEASRLLKALFLVEATIFGLLATFFLLIAHSFFAMITKC